MECIKEVALSVTDASWEYIYKQIIYLLNDYKQQ